MNVFDTALVKIEEDRGEIIVEEVFALAALWSTLLSGAAEEEEKSMGDMSTRGAGKKRDADQESLGILLSPLKVEKTSFRRLLMQLPETQEVPELAASSSQKHDEPRNDDKEAGGAPSHLAIVATSCISASSARRSELCHPAKTSMYELTFSHSSITLAVERTRFAAEEGQPVAARASLVMRLCGGKRLADACREVILGMTLM
jgi:hypothetical protein